LLLPSTPHPPKIPISVSRGIRENERDMGGNEVEAGVKRPPTIHKPPRIPYKTNGGKWGDTGDKPKQNHTTTTRKATP
jgi:hypothetical protein